MSPTIIVLLSISPFNSVHVCFIYVGAMRLAAHKLWWLILHHILRSCLCPEDAGCTGLCLLCHRASGAAARCPGLPCQQWSPASRVCQVLSVLQDGWPQKPVPRAAAPRIRMLDVGSSLVFPPQGEGGSWESPPNHAVLCWAGGGGGRWALLKGCNRFPYLLQGCWFHVNPGCRGLVIGFWLSQRGKCPCTVLNQCLWERNEGLGLLLHHLSSSSSMSLPPF